MVQSEESSVDQREVLAGGVPAAGRSRRRWPWVVGILTAVVFGCVGRWVWVAHHYLTVIVPDSYAVWWVADLVVDYMERHDNKWPSGWDDLREPYERHAERRGRPWTFEELQARVEVDWLANPEELAKAPYRGGAPPFHAIWLKDGGDWYWGLYEPNDIVWSYLNPRHPDPASPQTGDPLGQ